MSTKRSLCQIASTASILTGGDLCTETVEAAKTHDARSPPVRIDAVLAIWHKDRFVDMCADHPHLVGNSAGLLIRPLPERLMPLKHRFKLDRTLVDSWCSHLR